MMDAALFHARGYACPLDCLSPDAAARLRAGLETQERQGSGRLPPLMNAKPHLLMPEFWDLVQAPVVVDAVAALLGPDLLCYGSSFIIKAPGSDRYVAWHQDVTYWGLSEPKAVTVWIALSPSTAQTGCVRVVPGSHDRALPHDDSGDPQNMLGRGERLVSDVDETVVVDLELAPGQMSIHHCLIVHGSSPNRGTDRRIGFAARYIPAHLQPQGAQGMTATLVRGRNTGGYALEQAPEGLMHPAAVARHRDIFRKGMTTIFAGKLQSGPRA